MMNFLLQGLNVHHLIPGYVKLAFELADIVLEGCYLINSFFELYLTLLQCTLLDLDLFIQQSELFIPANELCAKDITLADHPFILFLLTLFLLFSLLNGAL